MKITVLTENMAGRELLAEHGLSYIVEHGNRKILFDTGHTDVYIRNAAKLGIDIHKEIGTVVLSHGHWDHGNGLQYLENKELITHPSAFIKRYHRNADDNLGLSLSKEQLEQKFRVVTSKKPLPVSEHMIYLGEIPRHNDFESQTTSFVDDKGSDDFVPDDSAIAVIQDNELIIITGCSHAGICNIIAYAINVTGIDRIRAVIGGFHLKQNNKQTEETIHYLKHLKIELVYPSHCTELPALAAFYYKFGVPQVKTGMIFEF